MSPIETLVKSQTASTDATMSNTASTSANPDHTSSTGPTEAPTVASGSTATVAPESKTRSCSKCTLDGVKCKYDPEKRESCNVCAYRTLKCDLWDQNGADPYQSTNST